MGAPSRAYSLEFIQGMITESAGRVSGWINDLELRTVFQPAFSLPHGRAVGFEASLRSSDPTGRPVSPQTLFGPVLNYAETSMLDLLCATMHVRSFTVQNPPPGLLLINLHPEVLLDFANSAEFLSTLFKHHRISAGQVMIDIPSSILEDPKLDDAIAAYREVGCQIAVDDFGVDNKNMDTIWHTTPTLVKVDRAVVDQAVNDPAMRQILPKAVSLLHEMGTLVLMEGIESEAEALVAVDSDADFASGFFLGPMHDSISAFQESPETLNNIWRKYSKELAARKSTEDPTRLSLENSALRSSNVRKLRSASSAEIGRYRAQRRPFLNALQELSSRVVAGAPLQNCCDDFLALPGAIRCYALDGDGIQIGPEILSPSPPIKKRTDFNMLTGSSSGNWSRRDFFRRAAMEPGVVQVTRQYCSLAGYPCCVTFSIAVRAAGKPMVICGDVDWTLHATAYLTPNKPTPD